MKDCNFILMTDDGVISFNEEKDFINFIINNKERVANTRSSVRFSKELDPLEEVISKILNLMLAKGKSSIIKNTDDIFSLGEKYVELNEEKVIQASKIHTMKQSNKDSQLVSEMSIADLVQDTKKKLVGKKINPDTKELYTEDEVETFMSDQIFMWEKQAKLGTKIHYMAEVFFKDADPTFLEFKDNFEAKYPNGNISDKVYQETYECLCDIKSKLLQKHPGGLFLTETFLKSNPGKSGWSVTGIVDLIVVDTDGIPHIYDFKTSTKTLDLFRLVKKQTYAYQLLAYKHILSNLGVDSSKAELGVIPITISLSEDENPSLEGIAMTDEFDMVSITHLAHMAPGGYMYANINNIIPTKLEGFKVGSDYQDNSIDMIKLAFNYDVKIGKVEASFDLLMALSKKSKTFYNRITGTNEYFDDDPELQINMYVLMLGASQFTQASTVSRNISKILDGSMTIDEVFKYDETQARMYEGRFGKYYNSGWRLIGDFEHLGILALANDELKTIDFITITTNDITDKLNLNIGQNTLLGNFLRDDKVSDRDILDNNVGNAELIKLMFFINNLYQTKSIPDGYSIGKLNVYEAGKMSKGLHLPPELLLKTFNHIVNGLNKKGLNITNSLQTNAELFASYEDSIKAELNTLESGRLSKRVITAFNADQVDILQRLYQLLKALNTGPIEKIDYTSPMGRLSFLVNEAILHYNNLLLLNNVNDFGKWNIFSRQGGTSLQHTPTSTDDITYKFEKQVLGIARNLIITKTNEFLEQSRQALNKFKNHKFMLGDGDNSFDNCFELVQGKYDTALRVKNPYTPDPSLKPHEIEFLKFFLQNINETRFNISDHNSDTAKAKIKSGEWFEVPLMRGGFRNRVSADGNIGSTIKDYWDELTNLNKMIDLNQKRLEDSASLNFEDVVNPLGSVGQVRQSIIDKKGVNYFSRDLDAIMNHFVASQIKIDGYNQVLPVVRASLIYHKAHDTINNIHSNEYNEYLLAFFRKLLYNKLDINDSSKQAYATISVIKSAMSKFTLALNFGSMLGETALGIYNNFLRFHVKSFGKNAPTLKNLMKGYLICSGQLGYDWKHFSKLNALNFMFQITDINVNNMAEVASGINNDVLGKFGKGDIMLKMNQFSEFLNKLSIMVAYMDRDGSYDAFTWKDNLLKYNWKLDKRFETYARYRGKESSIPNNIKNEYNELKSKYYYLIESLARQGVMDPKTGQRISYDGDAMCPYSLDEIASIKNVASQVHGYLDPNQQVPLKNTFLGSIVLMFKSYITAKKEMYVLSGNYYSQGEVKPKVDPITGETVYIHEVLDADGKVIRTYEDTNPEGGIVAHAFIPNYQEGILNSLNTLRKASIDGKLMEEWKTNETVRANMKLLLEDAMAALLTLILGNIISSGWDNETSATEKRYTTKLLQATLGNNLITMLSVVYDSSNPSIFLIGNNVATSALNIFEDPSAKSWDRAFNRNIGAYRTIKDVIETIN